MRRIIWVVLMLAINTGMAFAQLGISGNLTNMYGSSAGLAPANPKVIGIGATYEIGSVMARFTGGFGMTYQTTLEDPEGGTKVETEDIVTIIPFELTIMPRIEFANGGAYLYPGVGFNYMIGSGTSKTTSGSTTIEEPKVSFGGLGMHFLLGVEGKISQNLGVYAEFSHQTNFATYSGSYNDEDIQTYYESTEILATTFYRLGINFCFDMQ